MSRSIKLVLTAVSALALTVTAAPFASDVAILDAAPKQRIGGGWCC